MRLERHLLCLYRTAFDGQISTLPSTPTSTSADLFRKHISSPSASKFWGFDSHFCRLNSLHHSPAHAWTSPYHHSPVTTPKPTPTTTRVIHLSISFYIQLYFSSLENENNNLKTKRIKKKMVLQRVVICCICRGRRLRVLVIAA